MVYLETGVFGRFQSPYDREDQFMSGPADIGGALCHEVAEDEFSQLILAGSKPMARSCSLSLDMMIPDLLGRCLSIGSDGITRRSVYVWGKEDKIVISKLSNANRDKRMALADDVISSRHTTCHRFQVPATLEDDALR
jgi:hypothetical protein